MKAARDFQNVITDSDKRANWFKAHSSSITAWTAFCIVVVILFFFFSDGDFSFLLTLSSLIGAMSFVMVVVKIEHSGNVSGVSLKMIECYVLLIFARLCSIIPFEGYLPYDRTGDWMYQTIEFANFALAGTIVYMCRVRYQPSYDAEADKLNHLFLIVPALVLALIFHPSLNAFMPADVAWTFALYLEAVSALPQLFLFQRQGKVEPFTTHFLAGQVLSKALSFMFWVSSYSELSDHTKPLKSYVGIWVIAMQLIQLLIMADFTFQYVRCLSKGVSVQYILADPNV